MQWTPQERIQAIREITERLNEDTPHGAARSSLVAIGFVAMQPSNILDGHIPFLEDQGVVVHLSDTVWEPTEPSNQPA